MLGEVTIKPRRSRRQAADVDEVTLVERLRSGDPHAYALLVDEHTPAMLRLARTFVRSRELAEDVVQETWIAVIRGVAHFEGRASLRTWMFTILVNIAKRHGVAERRYVDTAIRAGTGGTVDPRRFRDGDDPYPHHWREPPTPFPETPEDSALAAELRRVAEAELAQLPERQKLVVTLRDVLDLDSAEVCRVLDITAANQRVLLHRGRAAIRQHLEDYVGHR